MRSSSALRCESMSGKWYSLIQDDRWPGGAAGECSRKVQQPHRPAVVRADPNLAGDLHERPSATCMPPDGKEEVCGPVPHSCHEVWRTAVIGSHPRAPEMMSDLGRCRSCLSAK